jgi:prophage regulatory protein
MDQSENLKKLPKHPAQAVAFPINLYAERAPSTMPSFDDLPDSALARQSQLVRDPKHPTRPTPLPFSPATFWRKVKDGTFPKPVKLGARITAWRVGDVRAWIAAQAAE